MTHSNPPKPPTMVEPRPKRLSGFLVCDACHRSIPYQGYEDPDIELRPEHRCAASTSSYAPIRRAEAQVRPFSRFTPINLTPDQDQP
jgi:hypothetical protein